MGVSRYRNATRITQDTTTYIGLRQTRGYDLVASDVFYDVQPLDTIHKIAFKMFGDATLWWVIADFNNIFDPFEDLVPGSVLRLPSLARLWMEVLV